MIGQNAAAATPDRAVSADTSSVRAVGEGRCRTSWSITSKPYGSPPGVPNSSS